jgi:hypothetical protein
VCWVVMLGCWSENARTPCRVRPRAGIAGPLAMGACGHAHLHMRRALTPPRALAHPLTSPCSRPPSGRRWTARRRPLPRPLQREAPRARSQRRTAHSTLPPRALAGGAPPSSPRPAPQGLLRLEQPLVRGLGSRPRPLARGKQRQRPGRLPPAVQRRGKGQGQQQGGQTTSCRQRRLRCCGSSGNVGGCHAARDRQMRTDATQ